MDARNSGLRRGTFGALCYVFLLACVFYAGSDRLCAVFGDGQNGWQRVFRPCRINVLFCVSGAGRVGLLPDCARGRLVIWGFSRDLRVNRGLYFSALGVIKGAAGAGRQSV